MSYNLLANYYKIFLSCLSKKANRNACLALIFIVNLIIFTFTPFNAHAQQKCTDHLNRCRFFGLVMSDKRIKGKLETYTSKYDGSIQKTLVLEPADVKPERLFFFYHGMSGDCGDAVVAMDLVKGLNGKVVALCGRGKAWLSKAFISDAIQVINRYSNGFNKFYITGISMGGTQALAMAGLLPDDRISHLGGVLAFIPGVNLPNIALHSSNQTVRESLRNSVKGNLDLLYKFSPYRLMKNYPKGLGFVILLNNKDTILPVQDLRDFISKLTRTNPVVIYEASGDHQFCYGNPPLDWVSMFKSLK